jgi:hypothetical protein
MQDTNNTKRIQKTPTTEGVVPSAFVELTRGFKDVLIRSTNQLSRRPQDPAKTKVALIGFSWKCEHNLVVFLAPTRSTRQHLGRLWR